MFESINKGKIIFIRIRRELVKFCHVLVKNSNDFPSLCVIFSASQLPVISLKGWEATVEYLNENGFTLPILVKVKDGLDLVVPPKTFTVNDIENNVGECDKPYQCFAAFFTIGDFHCLICSILK